MEQMLKTPLMSVHDFASPIADEPSVFTAANENLKIKSDWMTPAEALQTIRRAKEKLRRENIRTQSLMSHVSRRAAWDKVVACERCLLWHYFRK